MRPASKSMLVQANTTSGQNGPKVFTWLALTALVAVLTGCATDEGDSAINPAKPYVFPGAETPPPAFAITRPSGSGLAPSPSQPSDFERFRVGDTVTVTFSDIPLTPGPKEHRDRIREDGKITLPLNITVMAAGRTAGQLQEDIHKEYVPRYYNYLTVNVKPEERFFYVGGEVNRQGRELYLNAMTVLRAIDTAGGFTEFANRKKIELRRAHGPKLMVNWHKAIKDPKNDPLVFPEDQIIVHRRLF
jgi:polysaccharide export outer membrane protein